MVAELRRFCIETCGAITAAKDVSLQIIRSQLEHIPVFLEGPAPWHYIV